MLESFSKNIRLRNTAIFYCLFLVLAGCNQREKGEAVIETYKPVIMAYYVPERNFAPEEIPVEKLTHIIFSFTNVIDGKMQFRDPASTGPKLKALVDQKRRNPDLKVMIACGGWGADGFSDMALTPESRAMFIESAHEFLSVLHHQRLSPSKSVSCILEDVLRHPRPENEHTSVP